MHWANRDFIRGNAKLYFSPKEIKKALDEDREHVAALREQRALGRFVADHLDLTNATQCEKI